MYISINKLSASTSGHKPLHVLRIQQEVDYVYIHLTSHYMDTIKFNIYVSKFTSV